MKSSAYLIGLCFVLGCPTAPPIDQTTIKVNVKLSLPTPSNQLNITAAFFSIAQLELVSDVDTEGHEVESDQILSSQAPSDFSLPDAPPALYSRIKLKLNKPNPNTELPPEYQGERLSLLIDGEAQIAGGLLVPFRIQEDKLKKIEISFSEGVDVSPNDITQLFIRGDLSRAFEDVSFDEIQPEDLTDGVFLLDLRDQPFLNSHPNAKALAAEISENIEQLFKIVDEE